VDLVRKAIADLAVHFEVLRVRTAFLADALLSDLERFSAA
jgi:hypothetical protein